MKAKFDNGKCYACGKTWKLGDEIGQTGKTNSKGNPAWCIDGANCQGNMQTSGTIGFKASEDKIIWKEPGELSEDEQILLAGQERVESLAYKITKETHPDLSENSNGFGMIVNAKTMQLLALMQIKATKESST
jgi:hypothetical protein